MKYIVKNQTKDSRNPYVENYELYEINQRKPN